MTPLIKSLLSLLAASGTAVGGGLLYSNREVIFRSFGWSAEEASNNVNSEGPLNSETASGGQRENTSVVSGSDTLSSSGSVNVVENQSSIEVPAPVSVPSEANPNQDSGAATQRPNGQDGASISASENQNSNPVRTEDASQTITPLPPVQENENNSASDTPVVQNGSAGGSGNEEQRSEVADSGAPSPNLSDSPNSDLASGTPRELGQESTSTPVPQTAIAKDYQCAFGGEEYDSEPNKKSLKQFLKDNGGENQGLQILGSMDNEFKCAKDANNEELDGLKDYLETKKSDFSSQRNRKGQEPLVWAVKKVGDSWTVEDNEGSLAAIGSTTA